MVRAIRQGPEGDVLSEHETFQAFEDFMIKKMVEPEVLRSISRAVSTWVSSPEVQVAVPCEIEALPEDAPVVDEELGFPPVAHQAKKKRRGQAALRTELLGLNPKESRAKLRASLPSGFYICLSGKQSIRTLHRLGSCYALPNIDYLRWSYSGVDMPKPTDYDVVCTLCSRQGVASSVLSSGTESSSSTVADEG